MSYFAGGGGACQGIKAALGVEPDYAINHDPVALSVHKANHPATQTLTSDVWSVDARLLLKNRTAGYIHFSPDCRHFSRAKSGKPVKKEIRGLAWVVARVAATTGVPLLTVENVVEWSHWGPLIQAEKDGEKLFDENGNAVMVPDPDKKGETFKQWVAKLRSLGYTVEWSVLNAQDFGAPTSRKRLFVVARRDGLPIVWPSATHGPGLIPYRTAAECIDWTTPAHSIFMSKDDARVVGVRRPLAENTLRRIATGVKRFILEQNDLFVAETPDGDVIPYFVPRYGERKGQEPRCRSAERPFGTIVPGSNQGSLVLGCLAKHYTGVVGTDLRKPLGTITAVDHHSLTRCDAVAVLTEETRQRAVAVADFIREYAGCDVPEIIMVKGQALVDISMRMLTPRELFRGQGFSDEFQFDVDADGNAVTQKAAMRLVGNSVPPAMIEALVRANHPFAQTKEEAA
ncbi:DNA cytosine methyltransferase [Halioglobus sp. HI00S01]|uniref:DNA cytosine methyltransferase n=1 Tax=Halioglobus sp. HI00S01 TaxID=1822214 RepID=UPI000B2BB147|nr:DNA cytosine methyltransferase [Halioglobus sp. HI00S01]